jgi:hypothetical protein
MKKEIFFFAFIFRIFSANAQESTFQDFLNQFPSLSLPYGIDAHTIQKTAGQKTKPLDWEYYKFLPVLESSAQFFGRPVCPQPVAQFETENNYVILYNLAIGRNQNQTHYVVSVFTKEGQHIATNFIGGANYNENEVVSFLISDKLQAICSLFYVEENKLKAQDLQMVDLVQGNHNELFWEVRDSHMILTTVSTDTK